MEHPAAPRRHDLDWLRVFATYLLFVFHVGMVFNPAPFYHIRNADLSVALLVLCGFISLWHMPLFFLLAGWSAFASIEARGPGGFLRERVGKLLVPLLAGCVLLMPPIKYLELRSGLDLSHTGLRVAPAAQAGFAPVIPSGLPAAAPFDEGFLEFLPTFFTELDRFTWAHLWFLAYLFAFTLLYQPLFAWLRRDGERFAHAGAAWVYAPIVPLALVQLTLRERWPGIQNLYDDWANVAYYSTFLLAGFLLARHPALERSLHREWKPALAIGVATAGVLLLAVLGVVRSPAVLLAGSAVAGWCFVVALLGIAHACVTRTGPALAYLVESAFPVYVLHQSAIVLIGYPLLTLPLGIAPKYVLLLAASVTATLAVYHLGVRPFALPRLLLGMRPAGLRPARRPGLGPTVAAVALLAGCLASRAGAAAAVPVGRWYAEGGAAQVDIDRCGGALCGRVVWLRSPFDEDGCELRDRHNPDPRLRDRPLIGLEILRGLERSDEPRVWTGGSIYDPGTGHTYRCTLTVEGDRLRLRGYVGVPLLGRTTSWLRVGAEARTCRP
jgi:glucan biosynthesis protein C